MSNLFESYKDFNGETDFIKGLKKVSTELYEKQCAEENEVKPLGKVNAKIAVASGKFRKIAFDAYEKVTGDDVGSIWYLTTDSDSGEQWLTKDSDETKEMAREVMASVLKESEMDETGFDPEYDSFSIDNINEIQRENPHGMNPDDEGRGNMGNYNRETCPDLEQAGIPHEAYQMGRRQKMYTFKTPEDMERAMDVLKNKGTIEPIFLNNEYGFELTRPVNEPTYH